MNKLYYSVLAQIQYVIVNTLVRLHVSVFINHLQAAAYYMEVQYVCVYI
jgi:hypothetical protein